MDSVSATEFAKNFGLYREKAQREPVAITSYNRTTGYFISAHEFDEYQRLKSLARRAYHVSELPQETLDGISKSTIDPRHDHLNDLLRD